MKTTRVLLADDDRLILATLSKGLRSCGYDIIEAASGKEALERARETEPDIAILDIRMPDVSGIDVAILLRDELNIFSLFLTAYDERELVEQAVREGALGYLIKPTDIRQIVPAIETGMERSAELKRLRESEINLTTALEKNREISVAIGIFMERLQLSETDAFETLRAFARSERRKLAQVAQELVRATDRRNELIENIRLAGEKLVRNRAGRRKKIISGKAEREPEN